MHSSPPEPTVFTAHTPPCHAEARAHGSFAPLWWWVKLALQPLLFLGFLTTAFLILGVVQQQGWLHNPAFDAGKADDHDHPSGTSYICPMMCTPPSPKPGRCPVCGMALVPAATRAGSGDGRSVIIDPVARRVAGIETVPVQNVAATHMIESLGMLDYDEGGRKTLAAYVDGRIEQLYADYTGVEVAENDTLAVLYSPVLYSAQVEFLLARKARDETANGPLQRVSTVNENLLRSAHQRLVELGMTDGQIDELERSGRADSRLPLLAPTRGTVVEKAVVEGQYVSEGDTIYELAELSNAWLMLKLFPEDASLVRYGMRVHAKLESLPGRVFEGRVAFIDPLVDPRTRTVGIRVVMPNADRLLRIGDFATATIEVPLGSGDAVYDPELAGRWISPRHPHITADEPGACPVCDMPLVPATALGFTDNPDVTPTVLVVPRDAVLSAGSHSVVYVETDPGRFELRQVVLGPVLGTDIAIREGVAEGEQVARNGNFLIDSQMQLVGNPSLIDPTIAQTVVPVPMTPEATYEPGDLPPMGPMRLPTSDEPAAAPPRPATGTMRPAEPELDNGDAPPLPAAGTMRLIPVSPDTSVTPEAP